MKGKRAVVVGVFGLLVLGLLSSQGGAVQFQASDMRLDTGDAAGVNNSYNPQIAADEAGNVYVTWYDHRNGSADIYFNYSRELPPCEANLDQLRVYPNPFVPNDQDTTTGDWDSGVTLDKFTCDGLRVRIYTLTGELVREIVAEEYSSFIQWDGRNEQGDKVASGIYLYLVTNEVGEQKAGKLVVIK